MSEETNKLLESLMGALGDAPGDAHSDSLSSDEAEEMAEAKEEEAEEGANFNPAMLLQLQGLISGQNQSDERSALLLALRPFLSEERRPQVDKAVKMLKLSQLAQTAKDLDLLKNLL
ncbi:MAG: hypothetical protein E7418_00525 [Ruminococcaceae bacterium]|nr:hypothetical protein [Oscillospiraceae bacterium]